MSFRLPLPELYCRCARGPKFAVYDTEGLYIADASVMPEIPTSATNLTCFMIAERLADQLKR